MKPLFFKGMKTTWLLAGAVVLAMTSAMAQTNGLASASHNDPPPTADPAAAVQAEQLRTQCIQDRRCVCGRVLQVLTNGVVVDSGYADLLRSGLKGNWHFPGTVTAARDPRLVENQVPGSVCVGKIFLTDLPRNRGAKVKLHLYDWVVVEAYPAGTFTYTSIENLPHTVRRFACGLETAVRLQLKTKPE